jgi:hypothetical protein
MKCFFSYLLKIKFAFSCHQHFGANGTREMMEGSLEDARGERMNKLAAALDKAATKTLNSCTLRLFLEAYPAELTSKHKDVFISAHERFLAVLQTHIKVHTACLYLSPPLPSLHRM